MYRARDVRESVDKVSETELRNVLGAPRTRPVLLNKDVIYMMSREPLRNESLNMMINKGLLPGLRTFARARWIPMDISMGV